MMKRRLLAAGLAAVMALSMTACSSTPKEAETKAAESKTEAPAAAETTAAESTDSGVPYYVRPSSEVTGKITVYTTMEETQQQVLSDMWKKYYPDCEMEIQADSVGTLATRIRSDESSDADVVIGGMFAADGNTYHDILQPYTAACDKEQGYHDEAGYYTFYDVQLMCLAVNPALRDEMGIEIKGYEDLLNPALKGKIILAAPDASSSGWRQLQTILATMGDEFNDEKSWEYIKQLIPASFSTTSSKDVYNLVTNGEYVVGLSYESSVVALINDGAPIECVYMEEGNTAMAGGAAIVKDAPNLPAAQAMMDLLSSAEFQDARAVASAGRGSNTLCNLSGLPDEETLAIKELDFAYLAENKEKMMNQWNELYAELN
ncbi:MAG: extracellular solute-binding protein [Lacrimispora sp.]|uniref:extracellular solute-binding protein n=1 Tax=Lacrimispora sp. TaxID=2719234 RepID=UPI0039E2952C